MMASNRALLFNFDPFPFGFLTLVVSLEAIILSVFVLLSQNRQVARDKVRNDIEYDVNLKAEMQIAHMHEKVDNFYAEFAKRLDRMEKRIGSTGSVLLGTGGEKGQILRIDKPGTKPVEVFSHASVQYIWAMCQTSDGTIYAATGPGGQLDANGNLRSGPR